MGFKCQLLRWCYIYVIRNAPMIHDKNMLLGEIETISRSKLLNDVRESLDTKTSGFEQRYFENFGTSFTEEFNFVLTGSLRDKIETQSNVNYALIKLKDNVLAIN